MRKHLNLLEYALGCLTRYKLRSITVVVVLTLAVTLLSSALFLKEGLAAEARASVEAAPDITVQYIKAGRQLLMPESYAREVSAIKGVERVDPRVWGYIGIGPRIFTIVGLNSSSPQFASLLDYVGSPPLSNSSIIVGPAFAELLDLKVGDEVVLVNTALEAFRFKVAGILPSSTGIYTADLIVMDLEAAREFFGVPEGYFTDLCVKVSEEYSLAAVASQISRLPDVRVLTKDILFRGYETAFELRSGLFTMLWVAVLVAVLFVSLNQAMVVGVQSRFEVGLLKSLGFTTLDVIEVRLIESVVLGLLSASLGALLGFAYDALGAVGVADLLLGWSIARTGVPLPVLATPASLFVIYAITVVPLLVVTVVPAWLNAIVDPEIALRRGVA